MSTTFGIKVSEEIIPIARRVGIGNGKVKFTFTNPIAEKLSYDTEVYPIDNSAQGIYTIGDIINEMKENL